MKSLPRFVMMVCAVLALSATVGFAQTVVTNPTTVIFTASVDHDALSLDGVTPLLTSYQLQVFLETATATPLTTLDLGKPTPDAAKQITVKNAVWFAALTPKTRYVAKVAAVGPLGVSTPSPASDPFGNVAPAVSPVAKPTLVK